MIQCNTCDFVGVWRIVGNSKILSDTKGNRHECLKGARKKEGKPYVDQGKPYEWIEDGEEPDPNVPRQVRLEGNTWTQYVYGKVEKVKPIGKGKQK